ncbi:MAG: hypothetical protein Q9160_002924 [Pyrenula sp. 1 TL-2023]
MQRFLFSLMFYISLLHQPLPAFAFEVVLYEHVASAPSPGEDAMCTGGTIGAHYIIGPDQGCQVPSATPYGALVKSTGAVDDNFYTVFFSGSDCNPDDAITHDDDGCVDVTDGFKSFQVWDMDPPPPPSRKLIK